MTDSAPACLRLGRLTSPLAATLPAVAVSEERRTRNDFSRRFRVRQIERLLLRNLRSPESVGIPARARVNNAENRSPHLLPPIFCRIRRRRMVVTVAGLRAILAGYLMQEVFRNLGEGPAKRWAVKNAENRSPHLLPPIFLPDQTSANGCALPIKSSCPL